MTTATVNPPTQGIGVVGVYVDDQDEALAFYVEQPAFQLGLFAPGAPLHDDATAQTLRAMVAKGAMPPLVWHVADCRALCATLRERGVEFTQEPVDRYGNVDAGFRDPAGNGWKIIQLARGAAR